MMRLLALAGLTLVAAPVRAQQAAVTPTFLADFGGATDDPAAEMLRVGGVLRMPGGQFVVANGKPPELRVYDARGRLSRVISRRGSGPGEFQYGVNLWPWRGDSLLTFAWGNDRWMVFGLDGTLLREWPASEEAPRPQLGVFLHGSAIIDRKVIGTAGCPQAAIERRAPRTAQTMQEAISDPAGRLWLRPLGSRDWTVYEPDGTFRAKYRLPDGFTIMQFDGDRVVGVYPDDDGFPHVTMFATGLPIRTVTSTADCSSIPVPVDKVRAAQIKTAMRNAMSFNESYYSQHRTYAAKADDYPGAIKPSGTEFVVQSADNGHYAFSITDKATGWRCLVRVGKADPALDGVLLCGS